MGENNKNLKRGSVTTSSNKATVIRFNKEFLEKGNLDVLKEIVDDDFINHTASGMVPNNIEGLKQFITMLHKGFTEFQIDIHEQVEENDIVATRKTIKARHTGELMGHPPTGKTDVFNVMDFVRLRNGKYFEDCGQNNIMQVIQQL